MTCEEKNVRTKIQVNWGKQLLKQRCVLWNCILKIVKTQILLLHRKNCTAEDSGSPFFLKRIPANQVVLYPQHWATGANAAGGLKTKNWPLGANKVPEKPEAALGMRRKVSGHSGLQLTPTEVIQVHKYCKGHSYTQCTSSWIRNYVSDL